MDTPPIGILLTHIPATDSRATDSRATDTQAIRDTRPILALQIMDTQATRDTRPILALQITDTQATRDTLPTLVLQITDTQARQEIPAIRHLDTRAVHHTLPIPIPVIDTPCTAILAIEPRRIGHLGPTTFIEPSG